MTHQDIERMTTEMRAAAWDFIAKKVAMNKNTDTDGFIFVADKLIAIARSNCIGGMTRGSGST